MKVQVFPADQGGCGHYRMIFPARALQEAGYDVELKMDGKLPAVMVDEEADVVYYRGPDGTKVRRELVQRLVGCADIEADVVVLQRPLMKTLVDLIPHIQKQGVAVVVEVDDDFTCIPPSNPAFRACHPKYSEDRNWHHLLRAVGMADLVTVSTDALAHRYGGHGRVKVLRNYIPEEYLSFPKLHPFPPEPDGNYPVVVGWTGTPLTHRGDLEVPRTGVLRACFGTSARFHTIGSSHTLKILGFDGLGSWEEWEHDHAAYAPKIHQFDIGIVPLENSAFNRAKSWLKGLEYAASGVAFVASPLPEYKRLAKLGAGVLATKPKEWERQLRSLITDSAYRETLAAQGLAAAHHLTYERHSQEWWEAWNEAFESRVDRTLQETGS